MRGYGFAWLLATGLLLGCGSAGDDEFGSAADDDATDDTLDDDDATMDADGDGYTGEDGDCNDADETVHPDAVEDCHDGLDTDCDGSSDPNDPDCTCDNEVDDDEDGWIDLADPGCDGDISAVSEGGFDPDWPCNDGLDNDSDGSIDVADEDCGNAWSDEDPGGTITDSLAMSHAKVIGEWSWDQAGQSVHGAGDTDGDGFDDILIGAYNVDPGGAAYLLRGPVSGVVDLSDADTKLTGESSGDQAGFCVSSAGDTNGDGLDDILISANRESTGGTWAGAFYLVLGPAMTSGDLSIADAKWVGENAQNYTGNVVAGAGDTNGDGYDDIIVSAFGEGSGGAAYLVQGPTAGENNLFTAFAKLTGEAEGDGAGSGVAGVGDVDGDGFDDVLVGAMAEDAGGDNAGAAYLIRGPLPGPMSLSEADAKVIGENPGDMAGDVVAGAGDTNGDGYDDLLIGAPYECSGGANAGAVYLVLGPVEGDLELALADAKLIGEDAHNWAGSAIGVAGDIDDDGSSDFLVGAPQNTAAGGNAGAAYLFFGPVSGVIDLSAADRIFTGETAANFAGTSVAAAGDPDGDSLDDFLIGAPDEGTGGIGAGAAYLIAGSQL